MQQEELLFDKLGEHEERLVRIEGKLDSHERRLITIEEKVDKILDNQDFLHKKLNDMHLELASFNRTWLRHETELNKYGQQIRQLQIEVAGLKPQPNIS